MRFLPLLRESQPIGSRRGSSCGTSARSACRARACSRSSARRRALRHDQRGRAARAVSGSAPPIRRRRPPRVFRIAADGPRDSEARLSWRHSRGLRREVVRRGLDGAAKACRRISTISTGISERWAVRRARGRAPRSLSRRGCKPRTSCRSPRGRVSARSGGLDGAGDVGRGGVVGARSAGGGARRWPGAAAPRRQVRSIRRRSASPAATTRPAVARAWRRAVGDVPDDRDDLVLSPRSYSPSSRSSPSSCEARTQPYKPPELECRVPRPSVAQRSRAEQIADLRADDDFRKITKSRTSPANSRYVPSARSRDDRSGSASSNAWKAYLGR